MAQSLLQFITNIQPPHKQHSQTSMPNLPPTFPHSLALTFIAEVASRTCGQTGAVTCAEIQPSPAGQAGAASPTLTPLAPLRAATATPGSRVLNVTQGAMADTGSAVGEEEDGSIQRQHISSGPGSSTIHGTAVHLPARPQAAQAEMDAVEAVVRGRPIAALVPALLMAWPCGRPTCDRESPSLFHEKLYTVSS